MKAQALSVEELPAQGRQAIISQTLFAEAVDGITNQGMADEGEMNPHLVGAASHGPGLNQRIEARHPTHLQGEILRHPILSSGLTPTLLHFHHRHALTTAGVTADGGLDKPLRWLQMPFHQSQIDFLDLSPLELSLQMLASGIVLGHDD